jgi:hypothetical protein
MELKAGEDDWEHMNRYQSLAELLRVTLIPIFVFSIVNAAMWLLAAWLFWERYEFSVACLGFACGGIVVALCSYLYVLNNELKRRDAASSQTNL